MHWVFLRYSGSKLKLIRIGSPQIGRWLQVLSFTSTNEKKDFLLSSWPCHFPSILYFHVLAAAQSSAWDSKLTFQQSLPHSEIEMERWRTSFKQSQDNNSNALKVPKQSLIYMEDQTSHGTLIDPPSPTLTLLCCFSAPPQLSISDFNKLRIWSI